MTEILISSAEARKAQATTAEGDRGVDNSEQGRSTSGGGFPSIPLTKPVAKLGKKSWATFVNHWES